MLARIATAFLVGILNRFTYIKDYDNSFVFWPGADDSSEQCRDLSQNFSMGINNLAILANERHVGQKLEYEDTKLGTHIKIRSVAVYLFMCETVNNAKYVSVMIAGQDLLHWSSWGGGGCHPVKMHKPSEAGSLKRLSDSKHHTHGESILR